MTTVEPFFMPLHPVQLEGNGLVLLPTTLGHVPSLALAASDGELWTPVYSSVPTPDEMELYVTNALEQQAKGECLIFTVTHAKTKAIIGTTRYYNIIPECARLEIGYTWYAQSHQRTFVNTACKYLMLFYAFESLKANMVGWRADNLNEPSLAAIERIGAKRDGVIRGDKLRRNGTVRDSVIFSMARKEWPEHKQRLLSKIQNTPT
ncbi:GCN5 family N-acetyltransferase [Pelistega indica]|uniref:GCN5 family N-acetyltransferase n=1 Tax=Pelistega indica TaxID=1414851 RepID=V8G3S5_9BURK|nr:GNAT family protein [Pelistega indica]ETD70751.1 GCN5 family N-acetyltransferase [Pelistega indica]